ncbi:MAG: hypothetical protein FJ102_08940 [Deltaproteobacteria bacterium]|nr:hypothetical protein [Deltaproteobacteria bacterium]
MHLLALVPLALAEQGSDPSAPAEPLAADASTPPPAPRPAWALDPAEEHARSLEGADRLMGTSLWMGAGGTVAFAAGVPLALIGVRNAMAGNGGSCCGEFLLPGMVLSLGGGLALLAGPYVGAAGGLRARSALEESPGLAMPVLAMAAPVAAVGSVIVLNTVWPSLDPSPPAEATWVAVGIPAGLLGVGYLAVALDRGAVRRAGAAETPAPEVTLVRVPGGMAVGGTF